MINKSKVPFKYIIEYKDSDPLHLLYQIMSWIDLTGRTEQEFTISEVNIHTNVREDGKALPLILKLVDLGFVQKIKGVQYSIVVNPWK